MKYNNIKKAIFLERPNRFIAYAKLGEEVVKCHVKNTGRCKELLIPGEAVVYLEDHGEQTNRKTRYSLVKVEIGLARGKKLYDKREAAAERDAKRMIDRTIKERNS